MSACAQIPSPLLSRLAVSGCRSAESVANPEPAKASPGRTAGLIVAGIVGGVGLAVTALAVPFVAPALRKVCIPYVPATPAQLQNVTRLGVVWVKLGLVLVLS